MQVCNDMYVCTHVCFLHEYVIYIYVSMYINMYGKLVSTHLTPKCSLLGICLFVVHSFKLTIIVSSGVLMTTPWNHSNVVLEHVTL
jgi:hypothetical protein